MIWPLKKRQQVVGVDAADRGPTQVVGHQRRLEAVDEFGEAPQVILAQRIGRADRQPDAVQAERVVAPRQAEIVVRQAAAAEVVLAVRLDEADRRPCYVQNFRHAVRIEHFVQQPHLKLSLVTIDDIVE